MVTEIHVQSTNPVSYYFQYPRVQPIITPRFGPSCTEDLLNALGDLAQAHDLRVQVSSETSMCHLNGAIKCAVEWTDRQHADHLKMPLGALICCPDLSIHSVVGWFSLLPHIIHIVCCFTYNFNIFQRLDVRPFCHCTTGMGTCTISYQF